MTKKHSRKQQSTIRVVGEGEVSAAPDVARAALGVTSTHADLSAAYNSTAETMTAVINALTGAGIDPVDIQTTSLNVSQQTQHRSNNGDMEQVYVARNSVTATIRDITRIPDVLTAAVSAGANTVDYLNFAIADPAALASEARRLAVADARAKAQELAAAAGVAVGSPVGIVDLSDRRGPQPRHAESAMMFRAAPMPVNTGVLSVTARVRVVFRLE